MKVLVVGDSFAADWSVKHKNCIGWPNLLTQHHQVTNLAQAGVSQFRIYQQLCSVDLEQFDCIIITHTSPQRVVTKRHPVHANDALHKHADLIFSDIEHHKHTLRGWVDPAISSAYDYFIYHYDEQFADWAYGSLVNTMYDLCADIPCITIVTPLVPGNDFQQYNALTIPEDCVKPNLINHMTPQDNHWLCQRILNELTRIKIT
jgi:hypothetical protein